MPTTYRNTDRTCHLLGWAHLPEYCHGDVNNAHFVTHDEKSGNFYFHAVSNAAASWNYSRQRDEKGAVAA